MRSIPVFSGFPSAPNFHAGVFPLSFHELGYTAGGSTASQLTPSLRIARRQKLPGRHALTQTLLSTTATSTSTSTAL